MAWRVRAGSLRWQKGWMLDAGRWTLDAACSLAARCLLWKGVVWPRGVWRRPGMPWRARGPVELMALADGVSCVRIWQRASARCRSAMRRGRRGAQCVGPAPVPTQPAVRDAGVLRCGVVCACAGERARARVGFCPERREQCSALKTPRRARRQLSTRWHTAASVRSCCCAPEAESDGQMACRNAKPHQNPAAHGRVHHHLPRLARPVPGDERRQQRRPVSNAQGSSAGWVVLVAFCLVCRRCCSTPVLSAERARWVTR